MNKFLLLLVFVISFIFSCEEENDVHYISRAIDEGNIVIVDKNKNVFINNVAVAVSYLAVIEGCFSNPNCVKLEATDRHKGIIKKSTDDFSLYDDNEELYGSVTYFSSEFYGPYWVGLGNATAFRAVVDAHNSGAYQTKRQGCCANNPDKCHCYE